MESLAYLEMAVAYENARQNGPDQLFPSLSINLDWQKISSYVFLSSLFGFLTILGWPMMAHSQEIDQNRSTDEIQLIDEIEQTSHTKQQRPRRNSSQIRCNSGINSTTKAVQDQLRRLGYFNRSSTGCYGPATRQALLNFQLDQGLPVTGNIDQATLVALNLARRNVGSSRNRPMTPPRVRPRPQRPRRVRGTNVSDLPNTIIPALGRWRGELKEGDQNSAVKFLQLVLKTLGYNLDANGTYDSLTRQIVEIYQRSKGLQVTGRVGKTTMRALLQDLSQGSLSYSENLKIGDNNPIILLVQQQLQMMGLYNGPLNGFYSPEVAIAVGQFQQLQGIPVTNEVGVITLARLLNLNSPMMTDLPWFGNNGINSYDNMPVPINLPPLRLEPPTYNGVRGIDPFYQSFTPSSSRLLSTSNPTGLNTYRPRRVVGSNQLAVSTSDLGNNEIKEIQTLLKNAGYYEEAIDGVLGIQTQTAIFLFQEDKGLPATGEINQQTLSLLRTYRNNDQDTNIAVIVPVPPVTPPVYPPRNNNDPIPDTPDVVPVTPIITPTVDPDYRPSVEDAEILDLQKRLSAKGFYNGPLNGVYNWQTKLAIARAQLAYGITINDVIKGQF